MYNFIKRLPDGFHLVKQKPADKKRIEAEDIGLISHWFDMLEPIIRATSPSNIYNFDETGFQLGEGKTQKVISRSRSRVRIPLSEHSENLTSIECVAADGWVMMPFFIAKGEYHLERWYENDTLPGDSQIAVSDKGYTNDMLALNWLFYFDEQTTHRRIQGQKRVLLFDGHGSHLTYEFLHYCEIAEIITHIMQPLDGKPFLVLKTFFREKNNQMAIWRRDAADKSTFFREITTIRNNALKARTIRHTFAELGLYPFNPSKIIDLLNAAKSPTPDLYWPTGETPPPPSSSIGSDPPVDTKQAQRIEAKLYKLAVKEDASPVLRQQLDRVSRAQMKLAEEISILHNTINNQLPPLPSQKVRKSQRRVGKCGILSTKDSNRRIAVRREDEAKANVRKAKRSTTIGANNSTTKEPLGYSLVETPSRVPRDYVENLYCIDSTGIGM